MLPTETTVLLLVLDALDEQVLCRYCEFNKAFGDGNMCLWKSNPVCTIKVGLLLVRYVVLYGFLHPRIRGLCWKDVNPATGGCECSTLLTVGPS
ncbi:hypothetical protein F4859DRAFT_95485 [Xylaria cf. heliscus]|nr:hypothetical protein F4859DRAFT_95485 [Xylaria cf. heliscus]